MEQEGIFDGDYVIIERFEYDDARGPGQGELIVTHYLPAYARNHIDDDKTIEDSSFLDEYLEGPTVKYYYSKDEKGYHRLSWRKGFNESPYTVKAIYIRPIGRVIGVYRPIPS